VVNEFTLEIQKKKKTPKLLPNVLSQKKGTKLVPLPK
jgi:hypothetical protein